VKEVIFKTVWELKKEGYAETTVAGCGQKLKIARARQGFSKRVRTKTIY
jgi:hypothetical protein